MSSREPAGRRGLALGALAGLIGEGLALPAGLVSAAFLTRSLGLEQYGLLAVVFAAVSPVAWIAASVLGGRAAVTLISAADEPLDAAAGVIRLSAWIGLAGWAAFCAAAPLLASLLSRPDVAGLLMFAGAEILLFPIARSHRDTLVALGRYSSAGIAAAIQNLVRLLIVVAAVTGGLRIEGVILAVILARVAEIAWCRSVKAPRIRGASAMRYRIHGKLLSTIFLYALCLQLFNRLDILFLTALGAGTTAVSEFAAAQTLANAPGLFAMVVSSLMIAAMMRADRGADPTEGRPVRGHCDQIAAIAAASTVALAGASPSLTTVLFGARFAGAAPLLTLLLLGGAGAIALSLSTAQLIVSNRFRTLLLIGVPMVVAAVAGHLLAIPRWQATGAAATTACVAIAAGLAATLALPGPRTARLVRLGKALVCGGGGFGLARLLNGVGPPLLDAVGGLFGAFALMFACRVVRPTDIRAVLGDFRAPKGSPAKLGFD